MSLKKPIKEDHPTPVRLYPLDLQEANGISQYFAAPFPKQKLTAGPKFWLPLFPLFVRFSFVFRNFCVRRGEGQRHGGSGAAGSAARPGSGPRRDERKN